MSAQVEVARQQWAEGHRRFRAAAGSGPRYERLAAHVAAVTDELRRRVGQVFTVGRLVDEYAVAERWRDDVASVTLPRPEPADVTTAEDAAFHLYARAAQDFAP